MPPLAETLEPEVACIDAALDFDGNDTLAVATGDAAPQPKSEKAREREELLNFFSREHLRWKNVNWVVFAWMLTMHLGALAAPFFFTWQAALTAIVLHWATCSIGICMTYHRTLSHKSLKLRNPAKFIGLLCGVISGEGTPLMWAATHRVHHSRSDLHGDPHSPLDGPWWSHLFWMFINSNGRRQELLYKHFTPDLAKDKTMQFFDRTYGLWLFGSGILLYLIGGWPFVFWALCARMVFAYHSTWFVNSATHLWGYRNYKTTDQSRNLWWVALLAYGEGWHNNHHAHPRLAKAGHRWWELDPTWWAIAFLRSIGQAYDVDDRVPAPGATSAH